MTEYGQSEIIHSFKTTALAHFTVALHCHRSMKTPWLHSWSLVRRRRVMPGKSCRRLLWSRQHLGDAIISMCILTLTCVVAPARGCKLSHHVCPLPAQLASAESPIPYYQRSHHDSDSVVAFLLWVTCPAYSSPTSQGRCPIGHVLTFSCSSTLCKWEARDSHFLRLHQNKGLEYVKSVKKILFREHTGSAKWYMISWKPESDILRG